MPGKVLFCTCASDFQDAEYGKQKRVHSWTPKAFNGAGGWRCTVCLKEKSAKTKEEK